MSDPTRTDLLVAVAAAVIKGLPAPSHINFVHYIALKVDTAADVAAWRALDEDPREGSGGYDFQYGPDEEHPYGYRLVGARITWKGVEVSIASRSIDLPAPGPSPDSDAAQTVLAYAAGLEGPAQP